MKLSPVLGLLVLALLAVPFASANSSNVSMHLSGVNGANNGTYYVSPYYGVMNYGTSNAQNVVLFCDDINNWMSIGATWTANITNLGTAINTPNGFANTRYGGVPTSPVFSNPAVGKSATIAYEEAAWLILQFTPSNYVTLQEALWDVMNPGTYSNPSVNSWLSQAQMAKHYSSINPNMFNIITNVGPLQLTGQYQEFIIVTPTPEPASLALMLCGVLMLAGLAFSRARLSA